MKIYITIIVILLYFFSSCKKTIETEQDLKIAKSEVFLQEDIDAYLHLTNYYEKEDSYELLPYSLKMIKSDEKLGYSDYFESYLRISFEGLYDVNDIAKLDKPEQKYLLYILNQGALNRDNICKKILIEYYKNGICVEKNLFKSDSIYKTLGYYDR